MTKEVKVGEGPVNHKCPTWDIYYKGSTFRAMAEHIDQHRQAAILAMRAEQALVLSRPVMLKQVKGPVIRIVSLPANQDFMIFNHRGRAFPSEIGLKLK